jgi:hypothetical protein
LETEKLRPQELKSIPLAIFPLQWPQSLVETQIIRLIPETFNPIPGGKHRDTEENLNKLAYFLQGDSHHDYLLLHQT